MYGKDPDQRRAIQGAGRASTIGLEIAISVVVCLAGGWWLDEKFGTQPWLTLVGLALGVCAAGWSLYKVTVRLQRLAEEEAERDRGDDGS